MAREVLLISEKQVKDSTTVESNIDSKVLRSVVLDVQQIQLRPILGSELYNQILDAKEQLEGNEDYEMPEQIKELFYDFITPYLIHAVVCDFMITNNFKITNKGVLKLNDSHGSNIQANELQSLADFYQNKVASYKKVLIDYLAKDKGCYTGNKNVLSTGWHLENRPAFYHRGYR